MGLVSKPKCFRRNVGSRNRASEVYIDEPRDASRCAAAEPIEQKHRYPEYFEGEQYEPAIFSHDIPDDFKHTMGSYAVMISFREDVPAAS